MDDFEKYLDKAYHFLSFRPRSEKEVRDSLLKKKAPPEVIEKIINSLKEHKFLNDVEFARLFIEHRLRFRPKGMRVIKMELKQKGISPEIIEETVGNIFLDENSSSANTDLESAMKLVERKIPRYVGLGTQEIYNKLGAYLARRGFGWDTIKKAIDANLNNN